ncbi:MULTISPECIES: type I secretion system permease/ATPase [unclassified Novosphingobium]|uniref:type I secretion system permease/ATPase n=1 Tax=unclassified Novosphingobium TaxID=2644732 RepID=UPI0025E6739B|nr:MULTISPECIES: type I secretion system permease/ATPase [unclassified Novosphingobium]
MFLSQSMRSGALWEAATAYRRVFFAVIAASAVLNVLLLGGSFYMMLVYDSVLPSRSLPTLFGLLVLLSGVYLFQGYFETLRAGMLADVANGMERRLGARVQQAMSQLRLQGGQASGDGMTPMRDLEQVRAFLAGGIATLIDLPWILFFVAVLFALHFWLGVTTLIGAAVILSLTILTNRTMQKPSSQVAQLAAERNGAAEEHLRHADLLAALGMRERMQERFETVNRRYTATQNALNRTATAFTGLSKVLRLALQSLILTVGALLVIDDRASGGVIFAASILSGRALAPVDQAIGNWKNMIAARNGWLRLTELLDRVPLPANIATALAPPAKSLAVETLFVAAPGTPGSIINGVQFSLQAGDACGVIGPSGAGKSTLGRALVGIWKPARGHVRLDGGALDQWTEAERGKFIGYLPQSVELLEGTVAQNIARFDHRQETDPQATSAAIIAAARAAGVHELITRLPQGYDTPVGRGGETLPGGQRQRIGLARALYGDPFLVVLDEPNSNLDADGDAALEQAVMAIRARGGIALIISHRPGIVERTSHALILREGQVAAFGPTPEVLARLKPGGAAGGGNRSTGVGAPAPVQAGA